MDNTQIEKRRAWRSYAAAALLGEEANPSEYALAQNRDIYNKCTQLARIADIMVELEDERFSTTPEEEEAR